MIIIPKPKIKNNRKEKLMLLKIKWLNWKVLEKEVYLGKVLKRSLSYLR